MLDDIYTDMPDFSEFGTPICAQTDPELFFPRENYDHNGKLVSAAYEDLEGAKQLCAQCPYRMACYLYAMTQPDINGVWGGTTEKERFNARRRTNRRNNYLIKLAQLDVK